MLGVAPHTQIGRGGPVTASFRSAVNGRAEVSISLDYSKAAQPEFSYVADHCNLTPDAVGSGYTIAFGKLTSDGSALRTRIEVSFPEGMFQKQLIASTRGFFYRIPKEIDVPTVEQRSFPDPEKIQTFRSNNVMIGAWGDEGVADFYYLSPADFGMAANNQLPEIRLTPVVRVTMGIGLLSDFLAKCHAFDKGPRSAADEEARYDHTEKMGHR
jgi:hypothetical protein